MEDVSSFRREMIFHHRTDWGPPPRSFGSTPVGSPSCSAGHKKLDPDRRQPTVLAGFVGYVDEFLGNLAKEKLRQVLRVGRSVSVNGLHCPRTQEIVSPKE
jgi:hypothetical protein